MSSSSHLMSQLCIKVPREHVTVGLGTTSWGADAFCTWQVLDCRSIPVRSPFLSAHCFSLQVFALLSLSFWSFGPFSVDHHSFSKLDTTVKPQHLNKSIAFRHWWKAIQLLLTLWVLTTLSLPLRGGLQYFPTDTSWGTAGWTPAQRMMLVTLSSEGIH